MEVNTNTLLVIYIINTLTYAFPGPLLRICKFWKSYQVFNLLLHQYILNILTGQHIIFHLY